MLSYQNHWVMWKIIENHRQINYSLQYDCNECKVGDLILLLFETITMFEKKNILWKKIDFKDKKFPVKIRDIYKIEEKHFINISLFGNENKEKFPIYVSKTTFKRHVCLLPIEKC